MTIFSKGCRSVVFHGMCCKCQNKYLMRMFSKGYQTIIIGCFIHLKRIQLCCKWRNQPLMTISSKGCPSLVFDENVFQGISDNNDRMLHTSEKSDNVTIFSKGCRSVAIHMKKGDTLQASYSHSLNLRIIVIFPQLVIEVSWQQFLKVHFCPADGSKGWQRDAHGNLVAGVENGQSLC